MDNSFLNKRIASTPGAGRFRSSLVVIFIVICMVSFLSFTSDVNDKVKEIAKDRVLIDIKYSLAMQLYDYAVKGKQAELSKFHHENPMVLLGVYRQIPNNYAGAKIDSTKVKNNTWFFDLKHKKLSYKNENKSLDYWVLEFFILDGLGQLHLKKV